MTLPFPAPFNSINLKRFRESLSPLTRKLLTGIWEHYVSKNEWIFVPELHRIHPDREGEELLERLGSTVICKNKSYGLHKYNLTILGVILAEKGEEDEKRLIRYLEYLRDRHQKDFEFNQVTADKLKKDWNIDDAEAFRISRLVSLGRFCYLPSSELTYRDWHLSLPPFIHQLLHVQSFAVLVHQRILEIGLYDGKFIQRFTDDIRTLKKDLADFEKREPEKNNSSGNSESIEGKRQEFLPAENVFLSDSGIWIIQFSGKEIRLKPMQGLSHIFHLLRNPGASVPCEDLKSELPGPMDPKLSEVRTLFRGLPPRKSDRTRVKMAIDRVYKTLKKELPELEIYFRNRIQCGISCQYMPQDGEAWRLD